MPVVVVAILCLSGAFAVGGRSGSDPPAGELPRSALTAATAPAPAGAAGPNSSAPTSPPIAVCGNSSLLDGPAAAPTGAVTLPAGNNSAMTASYELAPNTTYWLAPGTHTLGTGPFSQFQPDWGDTFVGAPGAVVDGQGLNQFAFTANPGVGSPNVSIEHLTIENFTSGEGQGVVNQQDQAGWVVEYNTVGPNQFSGANPGGAGVMLGSNTTVEYNCLTENGEYGFSSFGGASNITLAFNEISYNDALGGYDQTGAGSIQCGCSGGGKFWESTDVRVSDNYVHDNGNVGIWVDTDNAGFLIDHNYVANNYAEGVIYEISYNGEILNNTFLRNALSAGPLLGGFPDSAVYISESGFDARVANPFHATSFLVADNVFSNNWGGVVLWENANRFCSDGSDQVCTLVDPSVYTLTSCGTNLAERTPTNYYDNCRWRTQNVLVTANLFSFLPAEIGADCTVANFCGENGLFSEYGEAPYSGPAVPTNITFFQNDHFATNVYEGPWAFEAWSQGNPDNPVNSTVWQAPVTDDCSTAGENSSGTCDSGFGQDEGSSFDPGGGAFVLTFTATPNPAPVDHPISISAGVAGGTPPYAYIYTGLPDGCSTANTTSISCTPSAVGNYTVELSVQDGCGCIATANLTLGIVPEGALSVPAVALGAPVTSGPVGTTFDLAATVSGGTSPYQYVWSLNGTNFTGAPNGPAWSMTLNASGMYTFRSWVVDADGEVGASNVLNVTVTPATTSPPPPPPPSLTPSGSNPDAMYWWAALIAGIVAAVGLSAGIVWRLRRGPPPPDPTPPAGR